MGKPYRLVVFDWEGTLADTLGQIFNSIALEAQRLNLGVFDEHIARQSVEFGLAKTIKIIYPHLNALQQEQLLLAVHQALQSRTSEVFLMPGAKEIVHCIHRNGIDLAIASNKGHQSLQRALQVSQLDQLFTITRSADQAPAKPCPQMLEEILTELKLVPSEAIMVGDSISDIEMAQNLGVDVVAMDFYHQQEAQLRATGALDVFDNFNQLAAYLQLHEENERGLP